MKSLFSLSARTSPITKPLLLSEIRTLFAFLFFFITCPASFPQDYYSDRANALVKAMASQTGLRLPQGVPDIFSLLDWQSRQSECEEIEIRWVSLPDKKHLPEYKAIALNYPHTFSQTARRKLASCVLLSHRTSTIEFIYMKFIAFGTTKDGEIRALHAVRDPREYILECPEFYGFKSGPDTTCGTMIEPEVTTSIYIPQDKKITNLVFFLVNFVEPGECRLQRLGSLSLVADKAK